MVENNVNVSNPFDGIYQKKTDAVLYAHGLIGTVRGKTANGLMIHNPMFNVVSIIDSNAAGKDTTEICMGVKTKVPIYADAASVLENHKPRVLIILIDPDVKWHEDFRMFADRGVDFINTSFKLIKNDPVLSETVSNVRFFDLRDLTHLTAYPNTDILNRKARVVFVTGTDCGLGKRTATYELTQAAKRQGINAVMYATGQTGLMLGELGTVIDCTIIEYTSGIVSQHICQFSRKGYELIFVEGQTSLFHPALSQETIALLHGSNPDCIIIVHDENRKYHRGFDENSELYKMHPLKRYIDTIEMLSLPCGPLYKTAGIATIGHDNISKLKQMNELAGIPVADVRMMGGPEILLESIKKHCGIKHHLKDIDAASF